MKSFLLTIFLFVFSSGLAFADGMPIIFDLEETRDAGQVWIQFYNCPDGTGSDMQGQYLDASGQLTALEPFTAYSLEELNSTQSIADGVPAGVPAVLMQSFTSGQIYVVFGDGGLDLGTHTTCCNATTCADCVLDPDNPLCTDGTCGPRCYQPSFLSEGKRYQNFETDVTDGGLHADLTYIDFGAISLSIDGMNAPSGQFKHQRTIVTSDALATQLAGSAASGQTGNNAYPTGTNATDSTFARILAPGHAFSAYHDWTYFLQTYMQGKTAWLKGWMGHSDECVGETNVCNAQTYDFNATVDTGGNVTLTPNSGSGQGGMGDNATLVSITIAFDDLNSPTGIYGTDVAYTFNGTKYPNIQNNVTGRIVGDFLAGVCFGYIGSTTEFNSTAQGLTDKPIGEMYSTQWWGGPIDGDGTVIAMGDTPGGQGIAFSKVQTNPSLYHVYADKLLPCSSAYGFGLQDRIQNNLMYIDRTVDSTCYLKVTIGHDVSKVSRSYYQGTGVVPVVIKSEGKTMTIEEFYEKYFKSDFEPGSPVNDFKAEVHPTQAASAFMFATNDIPDGFVKNLRLLKCLDATGSTIAFDKYASDGADYTEGAWWMTNDQGQHMASTDNVVKGDWYQVHFVITDGGKYDSSDVLGEIESKLVVGKDTSSSSSSGCVFDSRAGFSFGWLFLILAGVLAYGVRKYAVARKK